MRRDAHDGEGMSFDDEVGADHGGIAGEFGLPDAVAEDGDRGSGRFIVIGCERASAEGSDSEGGEIVAGNILGAEGPGGVAAARSTHAGTWPTLDTARVT